VKGNITASFTNNTTSFTQTLSSLAGSTAIVGIPKDVLSTLTSEIQVGTTTVWKNGTTIGSVSGVTFYQEDDKYIQFKVTAGTWQFTALPRSTNNPVITYSDCGFSGNPVSLGVGDYTLTQMKALGIKDDDISSLSVAEGYKIILYADDNFTGTTLEVTSNNTCIVTTALQDKTTSIRVRPNGVTNLSGTYFLKNRASGLMMDVNAASTADGASIIHSEYNGNNNQKFTFTHLGDGNYKILAVHSGKSLDVNGLSLDNGANVIQYPYHDPAQPHQNFIVVATGNGYFKLIAEHSAKVLEVTGASGGGLVHQWSNTNQVNGQWNFTPATAAIAAPTVAYTAPLVSTSPLLLGVDPNPFVDNINIRVSNTKEDKLFVRVYNISGTEVLPLQRINNGQQINLSKLPAGVYVIQVTVGKEVINRKVIKY
jgi:hypothetical protein